MNWSEVAHFRSSIDTLWRQEEQYWGQRSRIKWLNYGDKNTKFFHASTVQRRDRNKLLRIQNGDGTWLEGQSDVMNGIFNFYKELYTAEISDCIDQCLSLVPNCVDDSINEALTSPVEFKG